MCQPSQTPYFVHLIGHRNCVAWVLTHACVGVTRRLDNVDTCNIRLGKKNPPVSDAVKKVQRKSHAKRKVSNILYADPYLFYFTLTHVMLISLILQFSGYVCVLYINYMIHRRTANCRSLRENPLQSARSVIFSTLIFIFFVSLLPMSCSYH